MSKYKKLIKNPKAFFLDAVKNKYIYFWEVVLVLSIAAKFFELYKGKQLFLIIYLAISILSILQILRKNKKDNENKINNIKKISTNANSFKGNIDPNSIDLIQNIDVNNFDYIFNKPFLLELNQILNQNENNYLYMPWYVTDEDNFFNNLENEKKYKIHPFKIINQDLSKDNVRNQISQYIRDNQDLYIDFLLSILLPIRKKVKGFILTFDYEPVMRCITEACRILEIPTILIPNDSIFIDKEQYYFDYLSNISLPQSDLILGMGDLQKDIFQERGYKVDERFKVVGSPKYDVYFNYKSELNRIKFLELTRLNPDKKVFLFALETNDYDFNNDSAIGNLREIFRNIQGICIDLNTQLILYLPETCKKLINNSLKNLITEYKNTIVIFKEQNFIKLRELLYHSDLIFSSNKEILFESILLERTPVSTICLENDFHLKSFNIPFLEDFDPLLENILLVLNKKTLFSKEAIKKTSKLYSTGYFDGNASKRIKEILSTFLPENKIVKTSYTFQKIIDDEKIDLVAYPFREDAIKDQQKNLQNLINAQSLISTFGNFGKTLNKNTKEKFSGVDVFLIWGLQTSKAKERQKSFATSLRKLNLFVEDGFIRSMGLGVLGDPGNSVILDDISPHFDGKTENRLQKLINQETNLNLIQLERSKKLIHKITSLKISKYNHAPIEKIKIGTPGKPKILLIDQRFGDFSVSYGMGDEKTFENMLFVAVTKYPDYEIVVKLHPDATSGIKSSYFSKSILDKFSSYKNIITIGFDINPYSLFEEVEKVFVCSSGVGFEALMAKKEVHCFGMPFYANRGLTTDYQEVSYRTKKVSLETLFYYAYLYLSKYVNPDNGQRCSLEELVDIFADKIKIKK